MADGGVDFSGKESHQETVILSLLAAQLALGLETLVAGGTLVCKLYTVHLEITTALVYLVGSCFEKFTLVKPLTSRPANSEKYLVCHGFKGCGERLCYAICTSIPPNVPVIRMAISGRSSCSSCSP